MPALVATRRRMPALITKGVELFGITQLELGLFAHPLAQARFQGAMLFGIEGAERQRIQRSLVRHHQHAGPLAFHRQDGGGQADRNALFRRAHRFTSGKGVMTPSSTSKGGPIAFTAASMAPPRPSASSAWLTRSRLGWACGARRRIAWAISSSCPGPSRSQRMVKAEAMESEIPAQQWISSGWLAFQRREN